LFNRFLNGKLPNKSFGLQVVSISESGLGKMPQILAHTTKFNCGTVQINYKVNKPLKTDESSEYL
jgi:hypothetical protein